jgi:flagellar biosynthesis protein FlhA
LQQLLMEQVSIRNLGAILEVLVEASQVSKSTVHLVESVRQALGRAIVHPLLDASGGLKVMVLASALEQEIVATFDPESGARLLSDGSRPAPAAFLRKIVESVKRLTGGGPSTAFPVLLIPSPARYHMRRWLEPFLPGMTVLSPTEIPPVVQVRSIGTIG